MFSSKPGRVITAGIAGIVIGGGSFGIVACSSSSSRSSSAAASSAPAAASSAPAAAGHFGSGAQGSNARSGPAAGGAVGTVSSVSGSSFTLTTSGTNEETIKEASATTYENGTSPASASVVTKGARVLVLGTTDNKTITASQVIVPPPTSTEKSPGGQVKVFSQGTKGSTQTVGTIPAGYTQGAGTIVSGTTANKATEAALGVYPGGVVDRVVSIGGGYYEVHNIGVNWPHHVFENSDFQVVGAND
jgi:membrane-bound inhibitor of C-type lysozyme